MEQAQIEAYQQRIAETTDADVLAQIDRELRGRDDVHEPDVYALLRATERRAAPLMHKAMFRVMQENGALLHAFQQRLVARGQAGMQFSFADAMGDNDMSAFIRQVEAEEGYRNGYEGSPTYTQFKARLLATDTPESAQTVWADVQASDVLPDNEFDLLSRYLEDQMATLSAMAEQEFIDRVGAARLDDLVARAHRGDGAAMRELMLLREGRDPAEAIDIGGEPYGGRDQGAAGYDRDGMEFGGDDEDDEVDAEVERREEAALSRLRTEQYTTRLADATTVEALLELTRQIDADYRITPRDLRALRGQIAEKRDAIAEALRAAEQNPTGRMARLTPIVEAAAVNQGIPVEQLPVVPMTLEDVAGQPTVAPTPDAGASEALKRRLLDLIVKADGLAAAEQTVPGIGQALDSLLDSAARNAVANGVTPPADDQPDQQKRGRSV